MRGITWAMSWLIFGNALMPPFAQPAEGAAQKLQGTWLATKAERDGKAADDVVGHRLSFTGNRFQIRSKDGQPLYEGYSDWMRASSPRPSTSGIRKGR
jgi:hypothetical protein